MHGVTAKRWFLGNGPMVLLAVVLISTQLCAQPLVPLFEGSTSITDVQAMDLSTDGTLLAIGGGNGDLEVHTIGGDGTTVRAITGLGFSEIKDLEFSIQAERLIIGGAGEVFAGVVNTSTWEIEHLAAGTRVIDDVHDVGGVVFYLRDASMRQVVMLDMTSTRPHIEFIAGSVSLVGHSVDRRRIVLVDQRQVMLLDAATMNVLSRTTTMLDIGVTAIGLVGKGYTALIGTNTGDLLVLDVLDGRIVDTVRHAHNGAVRAIEVTDAGIYTAGDDGRVRRWSGYEQHSAVEDVFVSATAIVGIGVTYHGDHVAAATSDGTVRVFGPRVERAGPPAAE